MKISEYFLNKKQFQENALNHSFEVGFNEFIKSYRKWINEPDLFLVSCTTDSSGNYLGLRI